MRKHLMASVTLALLMAVLAGCAPAPAAPAAPAAAPRAPTPAPAPAAASPAAPSAPKAPAPKQKTIIKLIDSGTGSSTWAWYTAKAFLAEKHSSVFRADLMPTKGFAEALRFLLEKKGEVASTAPYLVFRAIKGEEEFKDLGPRPDVRLITPLSLLYQNNLVLDKSSIKALTLADLKGKTIATREPGSQTAFITTSYLKAAGIDPKKDVKMLYLSLSDGMNALLDGTADMYMSMGGTPYPAFEELFATRAARFIPIPTDLTKKANELSGAGLVVATIPANVYKGQKDAVVTSSNFGLTVTRADVSDDIIYELTRLWWDYMDERNELSAELARQATVDNLKANLGIGIQVHSGALKYYKERGWAK